MATSGFVSRKPGLAIAGWVWDCGSDLAFEMMPPNSEWAVDYWLELRLVRVGDARPTALE